MQTGLGGGRTERFPAFASEAVPHVSRVALLADTNDLAYPQAAAEVEAAARTLGAQLRRHAVSSRHELNGVFATMSKRAPEPWSKRVNQPGVTEIRMWGAHERVSVTRTTSPPRAPRSTRYR